MKDTKGQGYRTISIGDVDAIGDALAKIEFVRAAIVADYDGDLITDERAAHGAAVILTEAVDTIGGIIDKKDGTEGNTVEQMLDAKSEVA